MGVGVKERVYRGHGAEFTLSIREDKWAGIPFQARRESWRTSVHI